MSWKDRKAILPAIKAVPSSGQRLGGQKYRFGNRRYRPASGAILSPICAPIRFSTTWCRFGESVYRAHTCVEALAECTQRGKRCVLPLHSFSS